MYRSLTFPYWHTCQCMHDLVYETINMKKKPCDMILFLFKPSINETYMTLSGRAITFILLMKQIFDYYDTETL